MVDALNTADAGTPAVRGGATRPRVVIQLSRGRFEQLFDDESAARLARRASRTAKHPGAVLDF